MHCSVNSICDGKTDDLHPQSLKYNTAITYLTVKDRTDMSLLSWPILPILTISFIIVIDICVYILKIQHLRNLHILYTKVFKSDGRCQQNSIHVYLCLSISLHSTWESLNLTE